MTEEIKYCEEVMWDRYNHRHFHCNNKAKIYRNGKWYCGIHDPDKIAEKKRLQQEKWDKKWAESEARNRRNEAEAHYCQNLSVEYMETHIAKEGE